ncbi:MAG TPA: TlpA disulfide reductase family protein [Cellvibrionaceae bacterium]
MTPLIHWRQLAATLTLTIIVTAPAHALNVDDPAPAFHTKTLAGDSINLADSLGKRPIYLKFWATWCKYCVYELPHAQQVYRQYGDSITILMVNVGINDSVENIQSTYAKAGVSLPTAIDTTGDIVASYGVVGTPNHIVIDADGKLLYRSFLATDELDTQLAALAAKAKAVKLETQP